MTMTTKQAADYLKISNAMLRYYLRMKQIKGKRVGLVWLIEQDDLEEFRLGRTLTTKHHRNSP